MLVHFCDVVCDMAHLKRHRMAMGSKGSHTYGLPSEVVETLRVVFRLVLVGAT